MAGLGLFGAGSLTLRGETTTKKKKKLKRDSYFFGFCLCLLATHFGRCVSDPEMILQHFLGRLRMVACLIQMEQTHSVIILLAAAHVMI